MAYEMEEIQQSQEIFYLLLKEHEIKEENEKELFRVYTQNNHVMNLVKSQATAAESLVERYGDVIYLIPKEENEYLGFTKQELKAQLKRIYESRRTFESCVGLFSRSRRKYGTGGRRKDRTCFH